MKIKPKIAREKTASSPFYLAGSSSVAEVSLGATFKPDSRKGHSQGVGVDTTWPNRARYSIPCEITLGSGGGGGRGMAGTHWRLRSVRRRCGPRERVCFCHVFSLSVSLLFLFPLFAALLNCPYPDPPVSTCFLSILLRTAAGGGAAAWCFCCRWQPKPKHSP